jgi:hypothetical protein
MRFRDSIRPCGALAALALTVACHSTTAPAVTTQTWAYETSQLTDGVVTCTFGAPLTLTTTSGPFTGTFRNAYMACSGPTGASSTLLSGTVDSGTITGGSVGFQLTNTEVTNSGEIDETTMSYSNAGALGTNVMSGTATASITLGGVAHALTGPWRAVLQ